MEEVWKDINLASLNDQNSSRRTSRSTFGGVILQDFLARSFGLDTPNSMVSSSSVASENSASSSLYCPASPAPPLVTALSLSSRPDYHHFHFDPKGSVPNTSSHLVQQPHHTAPSKVSCFTNPTALFESLASSPCFGNNSFAEPADCNTGDRRNKRMIKNRESAARSRARKQAYTNELEEKVKVLTEENTRLKRQIEELWEAAEGQPKRKSSLYRTLTAPF